MSRLASRSTLTRVAFVGVLATASFTVLAPTASAATCQFDPMTHVATAIAGDMDNQLTLRASGMNLQANGVTCAGLAEIESVTVNMSAFSGGRVVFDMSGGAFAPGFTNEGDGSSEIEFNVIGQSSSVSSISVIGTLGNDSIAIGRQLIVNDVIGHINLNAGAEIMNPDVDVTFGTIPSELAVTAGFGNDTIVGTGTVASDEAYSGFLRLDGGQGTNTITGGTANDEFAIRTEVMSSGHETVSSGGGLDRVIISTESSSLQSSYSLDGLANDGVNCPGMFCEGDNIGADIFQLTGSTASETLTGNNSGNALIGGGGQDVLQGLGGPDTMFCSSGKASGGSGDDFIRVDAGCGTASGGPGHDTAGFSTAGSGVNVSLDDVKNDGAGAPFANVRPDVEDVVGSNFGDTVVGSSGKNLLQGSGGPDNLSGGSGNDRLEGGNGNDQLFGGLDNDKLLGGAGNDTLDGGDGTDVCGQGTGTGSVVNCE